jgi:hypothetical protein
MFVGPARFQYHLGRDGRIRPNADGSISVAWWLRDDHGNWQPWMRNTSLESSRVIRASDMRVNHKEPQTRRVTVDR